MTLMDSMFLRAVKFQGKGLSQWDVGSVTSVSNMFNGASVFKGDITAWNLVASADGMFSGKSVARLVRRLRSRRRRRRSRSCPCPCLVWREIPEMSIKSESRWVRACASGRMSNKPCKFPARVI